MRRRMILGMAVAVSLAVSAHPAYSQLKIFVETAPIQESEPGALWVSADFSGALKSSILKFATGIQLVSDMESADVILRHTATQRRRAESTAKRLLVGRGAAARASAS